MARFGQNKIFKASEGPAAPEALFLCLLVNCQQRLHLLLDKGMPDFTRQERLKSAKAIGGLFKGGHSYVAYPLRVVWKAAPPHLAAMSRAQIVVSVPKRNFKTAVARNRLKRQIREAYRLQKQLLYDKLAVTDQHISLMVSYIAKEALPYAEIEAGVAKLIRKFPGTKQ